MRCLLLPLCIALAAAPMDTADKEGFKPLFDGKTLGGWEGNRDAFHLQEGAIVG